MKSAFETALKTDAQQVEAFLRKWVDGLSAITPPAPVRLINAVRHGILAGGKRMRPFLVLEVVRMSGADMNVAMPAAAAIELIHCYSLVHDDMPCMDNDLIRRGQPTVHAAYDEATALMAGNVMLTHAFELVGDIRLVHILVAGAGLNGMLGGQQWDLTAEGRFAETPATSMRNEAAITLLQSMKTGGLISAAVKMGAVIGGASIAQAQALEVYAQHLGLAFQISDDILDATGDAVQVGKATGKDAAAGKSTFVSLLGLEGARARLAEVIKAGEGALDIANLPCDALRGAIQAMAGREK